MLTKELLFKLFEAFSIQRWNDQINPADFVEMDKHAHKMIIAYILGKYEEGRGREVDWIKIINGTIFELLRRIILSDIKSPVYHEIKDNHPDVIKKLNRKVYDDYREILDDEILLREFNQYLGDEKYLDDLSHSILKAAQIYSSFWEFRIIKQANPNGFEISEIDTHLKKDINKFKGELIGIKHLLSGHKISQFIDLCGQLRYQTRWAQVTRIPKTSVLGHMFYVGIISYLFSCELKSCSKRRYNNFFGGLFHDLPEAVTRDIISPVKRMVSGMDEAVREVEEKFVEQKIFTHFEENWQDELKYFIHDEFNSKIRNNECIDKVTSDEINRQHNQDCYDPIDGEIIRLADILGAYMETVSVLKLGLTPDQMIRTRAEIEEKYKDKVIGGIDIGAVYKNLADEK